MCVSHLDLGHNCDVSSLRSLRLRPRLGLGVLAGFLVAIPLTLLALSVRPGWDPVRDVDRGVADGLHGVVAHESWAVASLKVIAIAFHPWVFRSAVLVLVLVLLSRRAYRLAWWAAITMTAGGVLGFVLKLVVARARPSFDTSTATAPGFSFPSGHALNSAVAVLVFLLVILPALPGTSAGGRVGCRRVDRVHHRVRPGRARGSLPHRCARRVAGRGRVGRRYGRRVRDVAARCGAATT